MSSARSAAINVIELLDSKPEIDAGSNEGIIPKEVAGRIRFEGIHFRYPTRPGVRVLRELSLTVEPGSFVAIVGPSGSGKSTTIQLVERFYDPVAGNVFVSLFHWTISAGCWLTEPIVGRYEDLGTKRWRIPKTSGFGVSGTNLV